MDGVVKHLDDVVVDSNTAVATSHRVFNNPLDIDWCLTSHLLFYSITLKYILNYILYIDVWHYIFIVAFFIHFQTIYLHIDVQLVGDAVNHVDADDADSKTWWRGQARFHHEVDVDLGEINLKTILKEQQSTKKQAC